MKDIRAIQQWHRRGLDSRGCCQDGRKRLWPGKQALGSLRSPILDNLSSGGYGQCYQYLVVIALISALFRSKGNPPLRVSVSVDTFINLRDINTSCETCKQLSFNASFHHKAFNFFFKLSNLPIPAFTCWNNSLNSGTAQELMLFLKQNLSYGVQG